MACIRRLTLAVCALAAALACAQSAGAHPPHYLILRSPHVAVTPGGAVGAGQPVHRPRYSYGWFGAQPRAQGVYHRSYYGDSFQWSY